MEIKKKPASRRSLSILLVLAIIEIFNIGTPLKARGAEKIVWYLTSPVTADSVPISAVPVIAVKKKNSIVAGQNYGSDILFFGRTGPVRYPYLSTDIVLNSKSGVFAYGSAWHVLNDKPFADEFDAGLGYMYKLSPRIAGTFSYTHFFINSQAKIIKSESANDLNLKNAYDFHLFKTSLAADYLFGKTTDIFLTFSASRYFETRWSIFDRKDYLSFTPALSLIMGTQNFIEQYSRQNENHDDDDRTELNEEQGESKMNREFNPLNYSFRLPVAYNRPHYTIEATYKYSVPVNVEGALLNRHESFFYLRFFYLFY